MKTSKYFTILFVAMLFVVSCNKANDKDVDVNDNPSHREEPSHPSNFIVEASISYMSDNESDTLNNQSKFELLKDPKLESILRKTIDTLQLSYTYSRDIRGRNENIYRKNPVIVKMDSMSLANINTKLILDITKTSDTGVKIFMKQEEDNTTETTLDTLPGSFESPVGKIYVTANDTIFPKMNFTERVVIENPAIVLDRTLKNLKIIPKEEDSICHLIYFAPNSDLGIDVLNMIFNYCNKKIIEDNILPAMQKEESILALLMDIENELNDIDYKIREYNEQHNTYKKPSDRNIGELMRDESLINTLLAQVKDIEINPELMRINMISTYTDDSGIRNAIDEFNKAARVYNNTREDLPNDHEDVLTRITTLNEIRASIVKNLELRKNNVASRIKEATAIENRSQAQLAQQPNVDKWYQKLLRDKSVKEQKKMSLLQEREEITRQKSLVTPKFKFDKKPHVVSPFDLFKIISSI